VIAVRQHDIRDRVRDRVDERLIRERPIGWQAAAPTQHIALHQTVLIDERQIAALQCDPIPSCIDALDLLDTQRLAEADVEAAFAAVPVAVENHRVRFGRVQVALAIDARVDVERLPVQRLSLDRKHERRSECSKRE